MDINGEIWARSVLRLVNAEYADNLTPSEGMEELNWLCNAPPWLNKV